MTLSLQTLHELSTDSALSMLQAAKQKAEQLGIKVCISVVGPQGITLASIRMNGAPLLSASLAEDKAYTAVSFNRATHEWDERLASQPKVQQALGQQDRFTMLGGGLPVNVPADDTGKDSGSTGSLTSSSLLVGAVGVSGGAVHQDIECAEAAIAALGI
ncbi:GlcG/HbpS family heme-binding protein [Oceanospirillum sanctuarii]|uniref:GlcG/HbpS family heme-binding protein n=1 Tax=Oceanospirillum sanctuarii TaxID=1434821 RepID=UPI000A3C0AB3|nr:heme-binding protein [Oceanospirillum sanctuarii]